ncbi:Phage-like element PBSX protein XkdK [Paenibacillus nuruki]|uniref:Phage-like element PBSX protein XkdK n=1 Tax=Paenibacillus nuruki TaxID=1886670 RepID=A0A1E3L805_9BACL|nr:MULTISPECIES: phage tail sheath family protein [Paenibacillus]ODP29942.1 Phage-like element PBSX protein XkdK [Paenibacillus nuruki]TKJ93321.1 phage tail sheath protein [Paenibacillus sp. CFBP13512]
MAGGTYTTQNKIRPGVYINFVSEGQLPGTLGERGTASIALNLDWGASKKMVTIVAGDNTQKTLGYDYTSSQMMLIREALKRAQKLIVYRLNDGEKSTVKAGVLTATARYGGIRGNQLTITVEKNINNETLFDVSTLLDGSSVDKQTVSNAKELVANDYVVFAGEGALTATAGAPLVGGTSAAATNADHTAYLAELEALEFQTVGLISDEASLKSVYAAYIKRLRNTEGKKVQAVLANYPNADQEGVISVKNGVVLTDGTVLDAKKSVAWVTGATAGAAVNSSLTYTAYDDAVDVNGKLTHSETEAALQKGEFVFTAVNDRAVVEQDINTFVSYTPEKARHFAKNRVVRVLDSIGNDMKRIFESYFIGKVNNNNDGRSLFRSQCIAYLDDLQNIGAVQNFNAQTDITVTAGNEVDSIVVELNVQPVDSVEKVYMKVKVV